MAESTDQNEQLRELAEIGLDGYAPYLMNRIMGRYNANLRKEMTALGLSTAKMRALAILSAKDGLPIGMLGIYAVVEQSTLSRALDGLQADGLVRREVDSDDQRSSRVFLTAEGRAVYDRLWPHMRASHDRIFRGIPAAERQAFLATLHKMLANIRVHEI
ncbi:MarR family winged helix-turn-helix transcriptional regulator [Ruegeria aquimaris]|uniref:MarR family transcriptional regulator n=1 Tax=Ruegeria aquimaris TaxID=2984333 RepID=A0ABT3AJB2_9RHOB|nr:MarR family transcriptional regulator [Ruegeria sp. XHP0148]MCV2888775.1 MarR family transcriptional regulator [Ruegeria sp. XHP0148]